MINIKKIFIIMMIKNKMMIAGIAVSSIGIIISVIGFAYLFSIPPDRIIGTYPDWSLEIHINEHNAANRIIMIGNFVMILGLFLNLYVRKKCDAF